MLCGDGAEQDESYQARLVNGGGQHSLVAKVCECSYQVCAGRLFVARTGASKKRNLREPNSCEICRGCTGALPLGSPLINMN